MVLFNMPLKWKIFRLSNYLHIVFVALLIPCFFLVLADAEESGSVIGIFLAGCLLFVAVLITKSCINLHLLAQYYPEKRPGKSILTFATVILVIDLIFLLLLLIVIVAGIVSEFVENPKPGTLGIGMLGYLSLIFITGVHICFYHFILRKTIRRNFNKSIENFLEN